MSDPSERLCFNDQCFGWLLKDGSFDPIPIPLSWRLDMRGLQIEQSRWKHFKVPPEGNIYSASAHYPTRDEKMAPIYRDFPHYRKEEPPPQLSVLAWLRKLLDATIQRVS